MNATIHVVVFAVLNNITYRILLIQSSEHYRLLYSAFDAM